MSPGARCLPAPVGERSLGPGCGSAQCGWRGEARPRSPRALSTWLAALHRYWLMVPVALLSTGHSETACASFSVEHEWTFGGCLCGVWHSWSVPRFGRICGLPTMWSHWAPGVSKVQRQVDALRQVLPSAEVEESPR